MLQIVQVIGGETAKSYLDAVLDLIHKQAYFADAITDWPVVTQKAHIMIANAKLPSEAHRAIQMVLDKIGHKHTFFVPSPVVGESDPENGPLTHGLQILKNEAIVAHVVFGGPAHDAGLMPGDQIIEIDHQPIREQIDLSNFDETKPLRLTCFRAATDERIFTLIPPRPLHPDIFIEGRTLGRFGYLALEGLNEAINPEEYVMAASQLIHDIGKQNPAGWILDLRKTGGEILWPLLVSTGNILGNGEIGRFVRRNNNAINWVYDGGVLYFGDEQVGSLPPVFQLPDFSSAPLAVLTSPLTYAAGEIVTVACMGREQSRVFGEQTYGMPTLNTTYPLADGSKLCLTTAASADRTGRIYVDQITPDETIGTNWATFGTDDDPVIHAALTWLAAMS